MDLARLAVSLVPPLRRLRESRDTLIRERDAVQTQLNALRAEGVSPFFHYNASFDPQEVMRRHAVAGLVARPGYLTNFLGVLIDPKFFPTILNDMAGRVEDVPIPANWHADIAEWGAALRAVDLACGSFTVMELGCGWGCWMNNTGVAARRAGLEVRLAGIEGDPGHIGFAHEACETNGFDPSQIHLRHGIAAPEAGVALFPRQQLAGTTWGLEPVFNASEQQREEALRSAGYDELPMVALDDLAEPYPRLDLLHVDIQGGEADLVAGSLNLLREKAAYLLVGTHSRAIEGRLFDLLHGKGWTLEIERPAILDLGNPAAPVVVDGVQGWRNSALLP